MTMTETKLSDEEIQGLIESNVFERERCDSRKIQLFDDNVAALRQLHDEVKALKEDKRRLDWLESNHGFDFCHKGGRVREYLTFSIESSDDGTDTLRAAIDAALQQEKGDG